MSVVLAAAPHMAETWHLSADLFRRFLDLRVTHSERRAVVRHLITRCPECVALAERVTAETGYWLGAGGAEAFIEGDYAQAFQAASRFATRAARRVALERLRGWAHWSVLEPLPPHERLHVVVERKDWHHWGLFQALLDATRWYRERDPQEAAEIALLALDAANLLDPLAVGGEAVAKDLRAEAFGILADCRRLASDLDGACRAIAEAWECNEQGAGDPRDKAHLYRVDASYAAAVGEFETAEAILEQARSLYLGANEPHLQGRTLIAMGETIGHVNPERGIAHIEHGLQLLNPVREPRMELRAAHHLAEFHSAAGRPQEALAILDRARPLYRQFREEEVQLRLHWLQGRISHALALHAEAAEILRQVREEYRARDLRREFLLVTIDLAEAHVGQGDPETALRILQESTPTPADWKVHQNGLAAWLLFQKVLGEGRDREGAALDSLFDDVRLYFRRYWLVPSADLVAG